MGFVAFDWIFVQSERPGRSLVDFVVVVVLFLFFFGFLWGNDDPVSIYDGVISIGKR